MKGKKVFACYLKDAMPAMLCYLIGNLLLVVFYSIVTHHKVEILYPLLLEGFFFVVLFGSYFVRYARFYKRMMELSMYEEGRQFDRSELELCFERKVEELQRQYQMELNQTQMEREEEVRFASMLVHNMKTPVTVNDLLLQRVENGEIEVDVALKDFKEENQRLLTSLNQTLDMMRLKEFEKDYMPETIDLVAELRGMINRNRKQFIYHKVYPKLETELEPALILADQKWNELMLEQFISNGVKYSQSGEEAKHLYFYIYKENQRVKLSIRDEGIGIPEYDLGKICEPFFTGDNGRKGYGSSGIGLYFCREVAKCLNVGMEIESKQGVGTTITLSYLTKL